MSFRSRLNNCFSRYPQHGGYCFCWKSGPNWTTAARCVPDKPGVYIFFKGCMCDEDRDSSEDCPCPNFELMLEDERAFNTTILSKVLYIGKAGTLINGNCFKNQKLHGRIAYGKQWGIRRSSSIPEKMKNAHIDCITVLWFVTHDGGIKDLPGYVEGLLMQDYHATVGTGPGNLPSWNDTY